MDFGKGLLLVYRKDVQHIQLTLSLVAGPGPRAGVKISFFPSPFSTRVSPPRPSEVRPSRMEVASFSTCWRSGGGIILVDITGPDTSLPSAPWGTSQDIMLATSAAMCQAPSPVFSIISLDLPLKSLPTPYLGVTWVNTQLLLLLLNIGLLKSINQLPNKKNPFILS